MSQLEVIKQILESTAFQPDVWDQQMVADLEAGRLDELMIEALEDDRAERVPER